MGDLQLFHNDQFGQLCVYIDDNGKVWFCARDIAVAFDYSPASKVSMIFAHVPKEWKGSKPIQSGGGSREMLYLTEEGIRYFFNLCDEVKAASYQKWLTDKVIPPINDTIFPHSSTPSR